MNNTHIDCKNYLAIDVFKGICKLDKNNINADDKACEKFSQIEKCKHCKNFSPTDNYLGKCKEKVDSYAEMIAKTCTEFEWLTKSN
jgi:4-hydroxyphenylacetate decarboxylase small subunit